MEGDILTYALDAHGKMVYIEDVSNGLACKCRCPQCQEPLIAKNGGEIREHHFAHVSGNECEGAYETAFHLLAKEIISQEKSVMVPQGKNNSFLVTGNLKHYPTSRCVITPADFIKLI